MNLLKARLHYLLIAFVLFAGANRVAAQMTQQQELTAADGVAGDQFAYPVALSADGNTALIGADSKTIGGNLLEGAAYVFTRSGSTWVQQQELLASDGASNSAFGVSVKLSADGNTALIGAGNKTIGTNIGQGAAYVFTRSGSIWTQQQELTTSDGAAVDYFASSMALSADGSNAVITAFHKNIGTNSVQGAAYVFTRSGPVWTQQQELTASDGGAGEAFGDAAAISGDGGTILIDSPGKNSAYAFLRSGSTWAQQQELTATDGTAGDGFGVSVALSTDGNTGLVGAGGKNVGGNTSQGAAYAFARSGVTWSQQQKLTATDGATGDLFGVSAALSADGSTALIGACNKNIRGNAFQGAAYLFTRSGSAWAQQQELMTSDGAAGDQFGNSGALSADGGTALVAAPSKTIGSNNGQGAAYVFVVPTAGVPNLLIAPNGPNSVKVLWPNTGSYTLLQNSNLAGGSWTTNGQTITTNNGTNGVTITPAAGNLFFRLSQP